ncbi:MAG: hypothetical protein MR658_04145 [Campylobacter sp.]|nr:hypothetical protein [Campylobacter sp.]MCI6178002.1 hypothetical protein [Campylobacter sp.]MDD7323318.1 hypothetical protein [Campylobacteraceae bacterium]MDY2818429.1 hypothetical protein [Campylobacter lanienae]MDY3246089.1 hypothetical protein [Campylobacter sp.]
MDISREKIGLKNTLELKSLLDMGCELTKKKKMKKWLLEHENYSKC